MRRKIGEFFKDLKSLRTLEKVMTLELLAYAILILLVDAIRGRMYESSRNVRVLFFCKAQA